MQVCDYCGIENNDDHKFCKECGNRLKYLAAACADDACEIELAFDLDELKGRAFIHSTKGDYDQALAELSRAIRHHPNVPELHFQLGSVCHRAGKIDMAVKELERAVSLDRSHFKALLKLGNIYGEDVRDHEMAIRIYRMAVALKPDYPDLRNNLGNAHRFVGQYEKAAEQFEKAIELNPKYARAMFNLGKAYSAMSRHEDAARLYRMAIEVDRNHPKAHCNLGRALAEMGMHAEAVKSFHVAAALDPSYVKAWTSLAKTYSAMGETEKAREHAAHALKLRPELGSIENIIGAEQEKRS